ncbi:anoctamin-6-like [Coccinella septempunctata]|uniref:anoctamin-6-like n=1 Tax=Coccinella septempunctata TaxID=41139 RepID=UPI001D07156D|nr:anoctamin-6-like [Coccinella septempunctata]
MEQADLYLSDGISQIDYVIVYSYSDVTKRRYFKRIFENLLAQLGEFHIDYEISTSTVNEDLRCLKIHASTYILEEFANLHNVEVAYKSKSPQIGEYLQWCRCLHTILSLPDPKNEITKRLRIMGGSSKASLTQAERILLTNYVLTNIKFGKGVDERGVERILNKRIVKAVFPLHEGSTQWTNEGPLSERQLLSRYWAGLRYMAKIQPLNAIEKYFGPEMAFLYAYLQLSTEMQLVASIMGLLFFIIGISAESRHAKEIRAYICSSEEMMCPTCHPKFCKPRHMHTYCGFIFQLNQTFDNVEMFVLGICITLWGTIFMEFWKRRQTLFILRWNLTSLETDLQIRTGYEKRANLLTLNPFTNELEPTMSLPDVAIRVFLSAASVILLIGLVFGMEIVVIMMKMQLKIVLDKNDYPELFHKNVDAIVSFTGSGATVVVILIIDMVYKTVSKFLTDWENPRTQTQYDNSYMMKCFLFAFANNYTMILYIAFFKGKFFTHPGNETLSDLRGAYITDTCHLGECNSDLAVQVMLILGIKHLFFKCVGRYMFKMSVVFWKEYARKKKSSVAEEQWEKDYILKSFGRYDIMKQYIEIILRHGMVLFFTSVCPFTPLLTLIVNILEMKLYSFAYIHFYRRPIPRKVQGIEMFNFILQALTWFGVTVNALLALMTKNFAKMHFYLASVDNNITAFMSKRFSVFSMADYEYINITQMNFPENMTCYYPGNRFPPDHPRKYEEHEDQLKYNAFGWMMVVVYLHVVFLLTRLIALFIPDSSSDVTDYVNSLYAEDRKDLRIFRNQQYQSTKSLHKSLHNFPSTSKQEEDEEDMEEKSTREKFFPDLYFRSGGKRIDYVIVFSYRQVLSSEVARDHFARFLDNLVGRGFHLEQTHHTKDPDIGFIKIHVPHEILVGYADVVNIDLMFKSTPLAIVHKNAFLKCRRTALSYDDERSPVYHRAKATIGREHPKRMTQAERILITYNMLQEIPFGFGKYDISLRRLRTRGIVKDSFALHEGPPALTPKGPLTDRQLLAANWGDIGNFLKEQPLDTIQKYFGPELAFYFDFVRFLDNLLIFASISSVLFFLIGYAYDWSYLSKVRERVCNSEEYLCAGCDPELCKLIPMKGFCDSFEDSHIYDNIGTVFLELWTRRKNFNLIKWNLLHVELDISTRIGYEEQTDVLVLSPITDEWEPAMSKTSITWRYIVIVLIMLALMFFVLFFVVITIIINKFIAKFVIKYIHIPLLLKHKRFLLSCAGSFIQVLFIMVIDRVKSPAVRFMTELENCRTQMDYDNSYVMKLWIIGFVNGFAALFYNAFAKGIFYTNPGDETVYLDYTFKGDLCGPAGCNVDLIILLTFILAIRTLLVKCINKVFLPIMKYIFKRKVHHVEKKVQWESDYPLDSVTELSILLEYAEIVARLTMVLFFTAVFPFVPLIVFFCNYVEERVDANTYVNFRRRPIPRKVTGLGVWAYILQFLVVVAVFINALTSLLTKQFLDIVYYNYRHKDLDGYLDTVFSKFAIADYKNEKIKTQVENLTYCLYHRPFRHSYDHANKYEASPERFPVLAFGACFVVVYQHVVFVLSIILAKLIPDVSSDVEEHLHRQMVEERNLLRMHRHKKFLDKRVSFGVHRR